MQSEPCTYCETPDVCTRHFCALQTMATLHGWDEASVAEPPAFAPLPEREVPPAELTDIITELIFT